MYWINVNCGSFGLLTSMNAIGEEIVVMAAPLAKWAVGKEINQVLKFFKSKNAEIAKI